MCFWPHWEDLKGFLTQTDRSLNEVFIIAEEMMKHGCGGGGDNDDDEEEKEEDYYLGY